MSISPHPQSISSASRTQGRAISTDETSHLWRNLAAQVATNPALAGELSYLPNSSLYQTGEHHHYLENRGKAPRVEYQLVSVETSAPLRRTLDRAAGGATASILAEGLMCEHVTKAEAMAFISAMVDAQILMVAPLAPLTGKEPLPGLIAALDACPSASLVQAGLIEIQEAVAKIAGPLENFPMAAYQRVDSLLETHGLDLGNDIPIQVDLYLGTEQAMLGRTEVTAVEQGIDLLRRLFNTGQADVLVDFREAFRKRFGSREVPLLVALDEELGIGFPVRPGARGPQSPILDGLGFPEAGAAGTPTFTPFHGFLLERLRELQPQHPVLNLTRRDLKPFLSEPKQPLPDSFAALIEIARTEQGACQVALGLIGGPSGASLLGRFAHGDQALETAIKALLAQEESCRPESVFAEIVHLPQGKSGNITVRPVLRQHELPFLGQAGVPVEQQILVQDLVLAVEQDRIVLRSVRLGREVLPRLTTAHNFYALGLGLYRFLCHLQFQGIAMPNWNWGALEGLSQLPRVVVDGVVFCKARWRIPASELKALGVPSARVARENLEALRVRHCLPRMVRLCALEQGLPVDLDNPMSLDLLLDFARHGAPALLEECWPEPGRSVVHGPDGTHIHELIIPFVRVPDPLQPLPVPAQPPVVSSQRDFPPGSEWLYVKLYTGSGLADRILGAAVAPVVRKALRSGWADCWFFLRYADPDEHLRLRFRGPSHQLLDKLMPELHQSLAPQLASGRLWKIQLDTYEQELERYGAAPAIGLVERCFQEDSEAALGIIQDLAGEEAGQVRWDAALLSLHCWLDDLGLDLESRTALLGRLRLSAHAEFGLKGSGLTGFSQRFREHRAGLEHLLFGTLPGNHRLSSGLQAFQERGRRLGPTIKALHDLHAPATLREEQITGLLHMSANRLLIRDHRAQEALLYDFLYRLYESRLARLHEPQLRQGGQKP